MENPCGVLLMANNVGVYKRFRDSIDLKKSCGIANNSNFMTNHLASIVVTLVRDPEVEIPVVLITNNKEGPNSYILFSFKADGAVVGDYFYKDSDKYYFIYDQSDISAETDYNKFFAYECNVKVDESFYAMYVGNLRSFKDTGMTRNYEVSNLSPVLVAPQSNGLKITDIISIRDQQFLINDSDTFTIEEIGYYYLERYFNEKPAIPDVDPDDNGFEDEPIAPIDPDEPIDPNEPIEPVKPTHIAKSPLYSGQEVTLTTDLGQFSSNPTVEVIKKSKTSVTFKAPNYAVETLIVETFSDVYKYKVKESI